MTFADLFGRIQLLTGMKAEKTPEFHAEVVKFLDNAKASGSISTEEAASLLEMYPDYIG